MMRHAGERYFESTGVPIRYVDEGQGTPVILIHGITSAATSWADIGVMQVLSEQHRSIALDLRGHGNSGKPHDPAAYGKQMVRDVIALLDFLRIEDAHIIGYSMGAEIALRLVVAYPARVRSLIIGGSGWSGRHESEVYTRLADSLKDHGSVGPALRWMRAERPGEPFPAPTDEEIAAADEFLDDQDSRAIQALARSMSDVVNLSNDEVAAIPVPILGITGEHDIERYTLEKMTGVAPDFTLKVIAGTDHMTAVMDPQFIASITDFLRR